MFDYKFEGFFFFFEDMLELLDVMVVLGYFSCNIGVFIEIDKEILRKFLFYLRKSGGVGKFEGKRVFVIFCEFFVVEFLIVEVSFDCWFLEFD